VAADRLEQRRLAAARRSEQDEAVGTLDVEIDAVRRGDEMVLRLVLQRHAAHGEERRRSCRVVHRTTLRAPRFGAGCECSGEPGRIANCTTRPDIAPRNCSLNAW